MLVAVCLAPVSRVAAQTLADLIPQNIASPTTVAPGASFTATWTLANIGTAAANATSTTAVRINQSTTSAAGTNLASVPTAALAAGASVGQTATLTAPTTPGTYYVWVLADNLSAVTNQSNTGNDLQHSAAFTVQATATQADLLLSMTDSPDPVAVNAGLTYGVTVTNAGPAPAAAVSITDTLPINVTYVSATATAGACSASGTPATVTCSLGTITVGGSATATIVTKATVAGVVSNSASVASSTPDPYPANNQVSTATTVGAPGLAPLASFTFLPAAPTVGAPVQFIDASTGAAPLLRAWDLNADNTADSSSASPQYTFVAPGSYNVTLTVSNAYGSSTATRTVTVSPVPSAGIPVITSVTRDFPGFFLRGSSIANTFHVGVNWAGTPGTVSFSVNGKPAVVEPGTSAGASHTFNMDQDFPARLEASIVTIIATNAQGGISGPSKAGVSVFPYPAWLSTPSNLGSLSFKTGAGVVTGAFSFDQPNPHIAADGPIQIPGWVPFVGGRFGLTETYAGVGGAFSSTGTGTLSLQGQSGFEAMGQSLEGSLGGSGDLRFGSPTGLALTSAAFTANVTGTIRKEWGLLDAIPPLGTLANNTLLLRPAISWLNEHAALEGSIAPSLAFTAAFAQAADGQLHFSESTGTIGLDMKATLKVNVIDNHFSAKGWAAGSGAITVGVPQPYVRAAQFGLETGVSFEIDGLWGVVLAEGEAKYDVRCSWSASSDLNANCSAGASAISDSPSLSVIRPQYSRFGKASVFLPRRIAPSATSKAPVSVEATSLVTNVFPGATPRLIQVGANGQVLLWVSQNASLPVTQSTDITWSYNDGGGWTTPSAIVSDTRAELAPVAGVDGSGRVVAAWLRIKDASFSTPIETIDDLPLFYTRLEVVTAVFNPATRTWGAVTPLTNDADADTNLHLSADANGHLLLTWLANPHAEFTSTTTNPSVLKYSFWNGSAWSTPGVVAAGLVGVSTHVAGIHGSQAVVLVHRDPDPNQVDDETLETYVWNGSSWTGPTTFATGGGDNRQPSFVYDASGTAHVVWLRGSDLVHATLDSPTPQVVRSNSGSLGLHGAQLLVNLQGNLTLVWLRTAESGPAQIFARLFDPASNTWSVDVPLTDDPRLAHDVAGFYADDGALHLAYLSTEILRTDTTVVIGGVPTTIGNIPQDGSTELWLLDHSLARNLTVRDDDLIVTPRRPLPGDSVTARLTVHNSGDFPVSGFAVGVYVGDPQNGGTSVGTATVSDPISAGDQRVLEFHFVYPASGGNVVAVADAGGNIAEASEADNVAVYHLNNHAPTARLVANVTDGVRPLAVTLDASSSSDDDGDPLTFSWSFGDGSPNQSGNTASHVFTSAGVYPATVVVTDTFGASATATVSITVELKSDDPLPGISIGDVSVVEGYSGTVNAVFPVTLSAPSGQVVTTNYATADNTATVAGADYVAIAGSLTFAPGVTTQLITVLVNGDAVDEPNETFFVNLSGVANATIAKGQGVGTIVNDDGRFFYTVAPCRLLDTRDAAIGAPSLVANATRPFTIPGRCAIPPSAKAVSINVTVTGATAGGDLRLYPGGTARPLVSTVNYGVGQTRANNAVVFLGADGTLAVFCEQPSGTVDFILDVNGYLQ